MRILQVNQFCGSEGGTEVYVHSISNDLIERGHSVSLLCEKRCNDQRDFSYEVHQVSGISMWSFQKDETVLAGVEEVVKVENPDVINVHNIHNSWVTECLLRLRPTVRYLHDHRLFCPRGKYYVSGKTCTRPFGGACVFNSFLPSACYGYLSRRPWRTWREFRSIKETTKANMRLKKLFVASNYMKRCLVQNGFRSGMVGLLPYFTEIPDEAGPPGEEILYVGRLLPEKGVHLLLDSLAMMTGSPRLVVVGDGPADYKDLLQRRISRLGLGSTVRFAGRVGHDELGKFYQGCRLLAMPSIWPEPFGMVGIEALSHSRPVVAFDSGGVREWLIDGETGFLARKGDARALAGKIMCLLDSPDVALNMGKKGRSMVRDRFSRKGHMEKLLQLYEEACG
ncbi:MAG: glycosyltransferase family 4 protein [bacterium]